MPIPGSRSADPEPSGRATESSFVSRLPWWGWIVGVDLLLLMLTALDNYSGELPYAWRLTRTFRVTYEMNLGAWWSGILLLVAALLCYELWTGRDRTLRWEWLGLGLVLAFLSLDEIGSLHERADLMDNLDRFVVAAALLAIVPLYAVFRMWRQPETRTASVLICVAFALMASVAGHEKIQWTVQWSDLPRWAGVLRAQAEEGTELLASLLILAAVIPHRRGAGSRSFEALVPDLRDNRPLTVTVLVGLALTVVAHVWVAGNLGPGDTGDPAVWYPEALGFMSFAVAYWASRASLEGIRTAWRVIAAGFLLSSAALMTDTPGLLPGMSASVDLWHRLLVLYGWQSCLIIWLIRQRYIMSANGVIMLALSAAAVAAHVRSMDQQGLQLLVYSAFCCMIWLAVSAAARAARTTPGAPAPSADTATS